MAGPFGNEGLKAPPPPPDPLSVVDAAGDVVVSALPGTVARVVRNVGAAVQGAGAEAMGAVSSVKDAPGDVPPDPVSLVSAGINYVLAVPKGGLGVIKGIFTGVEESINDVTSRGRRLTGK